MKTNIFKTVALISALTVSSAAYAEPIFIDLNKGGDYSVITPDLNVSYDSFTNIDLTTGLLTTVAGVNAIGTQYADFVDATSNTVASGVPGIPDATNLINNVSNYNEGHDGTNSFLTFGISLNGTFNATTGITYTSGVLTLFSGDLLGTTDQVDNLSKTELFSANFVSGGLTIGNQEVLTSVDEASFTAAGEDTFFVAKSGALISFEDYLAANTTSLITMLIDQNVTGGVNPLLTQVQDQVVDALAIAGGDVTDAGYLAAISDINVSGRHAALVTVSVPEPTSLAILGLGLLGLAGAKRRKN